MSARVLQLIEVDQQRGDGHTRVLRTVKVYYTLDGEYVAEAHDPWHHHCADPGHDHDGGWRDQK